MFSSWTICSMNTCLSWPSFRSHLSKVTTMPSPERRSARSSTHCSCCGVVQLYEMNTLGCELLPSIGLSPQTRAASPSCHIGLHLSPKRLVQNRRHEDGKLGRGFCLQD